METALKQRLIGAIVLVALAVIFLPMLVKGPAPDSSVADIPLQVPDAPAGQYETRELPLVTPGNVPAEGVVGLSPSDSADTATPAATVALPAATAGGNYAVSFGAYASAKDADAVITRLRQARLPGYTEPTTINGKPAFRVRIGPYADQATAEAMRLEAVKVRSDVKAQVVVLDAAGDHAAATASAAAPSTPVSQPVVSSPAVTTQTLPPEPARTPAPTTTSTPKPTVTPSKPATAPVTTAATKPATPPTSPPRTETPKPAASSVGFAVQLGAFASADDAKALRDRVRAGGYSAFIEQVRTDKGTLNRVRVGPVANRDAADRLKAQIASKFGISGMVRPHP